MTLGQMILKVAQISDDRWYSNKDYQLGKGVNIAQRKIMYPRYAAIRDHFVHV